MTTFYFGACPKCGGTMTLEHELGFKNLHYLQCMNCAHCAYDTQPEVFVPKNRRSLPGTYRNHSKEQEGRHQGLGETLKPDDHPFEASLTWT